MKIKVSEASGQQLNWLVALAEGYDEGWLIRQLGNPNPETRAIFDYAADWGDAGPIIERELIELIREDDHWYGRSPTHSSFGPTPLIAAMRCFASKLGEEIEVPEELL
jgi:hypothetical protein